MVRVEIPLATAGRIDAPSEAQPDPHLLCGFL
jgi:hypothetical protein